MCDNKVSFMLNKYKLIHQSV